MIIVEKIEFAGHEIKIVGTADANGTDLEPNDIMPPGSEIVVTVHNKQEHRHDEAVALNVSVNFHGTAPELKLPWCLVGTRHPGAAKKDPWGIVQPGERVELRHTTERALALTKVFLMALPVKASAAPPPVESIVDEKPRLWSLCLEHRQTLDGYARAFPPAVETAEKALQFLYVMADDETMQMPGARCPACAIGEDRPEDADYACLRAVRCALSPDLVPLDLVVQVVRDPNDPYAGRPLEVGEATVEVGGDVSDEHYNVTLCLADHRQNPLPPIKIQAFRHGPSRMGRHLRFTLTPIDCVRGETGVWKLSPSLNVPGVVRAFITLTGLGL